MLANDPLTKKISNKKSIILIIVRNAIAATKKKIYLKN